MEERQGGENHGSRMEEEKLAGPPRMLCPEFSDSM
jgi:hypothetical protein